MLIFLATLALAGPDLTLQVEPSPSPAVVELALESLLWINLDHPSGAPEVVAEILGDDLMHCPNLTSPQGFRPSHDAELWKKGLLRYAVIEVTASAIYVSGSKVVDLHQGRVPVDHKHGVVIRPLLKVLLRQNEAQHQFANACGHPDYQPKGRPTSGASGRLLLAVAPDMPFDLINEVLLTARKARFKYFYLYASSTNIARDPLLVPPTLNDVGLRVFVASDGGLGLDADVEGTEDAAALRADLPEPTATSQARVVPYPASPYGAVASAAGALLAKGWNPAVLARLDADDLRATRQPPRPRRASSTVSGRSPITAIPIVLPEGAEQDLTSPESQRTRFSITGSSPHVATFTPPAHVADALNTPEVGAQLKKVLSCYRDEEEDTPGLAGKLYLELRVSPTGRPDRVSYLPTSTLDDVHLRECVQDAFLGLDLPKAALSPEPMLWGVQFTLSKR
ncbi:MAG: hypothetical protein EA397_03335 [Deltaproteobacteria bacterium]|nr:MAG: hypothetical protein EA397_03335 [Deltaproteobacteria bacterium]